jgi:hypothetical protein
MGVLKAELNGLDASLYTPLEVARLLGTTVGTIYALSSRYNINFKKAPWGYYKHNLNAKTKKV